MPRPKPRVPIRHFLMWCRSASPWRSRRGTITCRCCVRPGAIRPTAAASCRIASILQPLTYTTSLAQSRFFGDDAHLTGGMAMNLSGESLLVILIVGLVAGWLAGKLVRGAGFGLIGDIVIGIIGAFIASWLFPRLGIQLGTGMIREIVNSTIGAVLLLIIIRLIRGGGRW